MPTNMADKHEREYRYMYRHGDERGHGRRHGNGHENGQDKNVNTEHKQGHARQSQY